VSLLPLEPYVYPADLLAEPGSGEGVAGRWWVLHTRPRAEKALARTLFQKGQAFFLPLTAKQWRSRGRLFSSHLPLFPGYVFLRGDDETRLTAVKTNQVVRVLDVPDGDRLARDLSRLHRVMQEGLPLVPEERLQPGMPVTLTAGPLAGLDGTIVRRGKGYRFIIRVDFIQRGASVEVEAWMLAPSCTRVGVRDAAPYAV
jgi:transcription antitermination factor NusG